MAYINSWFWWPRGYIYAVQHRKKEHTMKRYAQNIKWLALLLIPWVFLLGPHTLWFMSVLGVLVLSLLAVILHYESGVPWHTVAWLVPGIAIAVAVILSSLLYLGATNYWLFGAFCVLLVVAASWLERWLRQRRRKNM